MDGFTESGCSVSSTGVSGIIRISDGCIDLTEKLHQLPCVIKYNGQCPVSDYFQPEITGVVVDELELKESSFRGRKLARATLAISGSYCGFVLGKMKPEDHNGVSKASNLEEGGVDSWKATASFDNITYWNHDNLPSESDTFNCCFHWFPVANAIHKPITAAEIATETHRDGKKAGGRSHPRAQEIYVMLEIMSWEMK
ncbi:hypothetical protein KI387_033793, partial [Taxus chinensis]